MTLRTLVSGVCVVSSVVRPNVIDFEWVVADLLTDPAIKNTSHIRAERTDFALNIGYRYRRKRNTRTFRAPTHNGWVVNYTIQ